MKNPRNSATKRGFTLMELMVAMAITTIIVTVLVSITSIALDTWNRSRSELRASRQAKSMIDTMARDFESLVIRRGNTNQWLSAIDSPATVGKSIESTNASEFIFFTAVTDRYNGQVGVSGTDMGGDVSCVAYKLDYRDPIDTGGGSTDFQTFVMNRLLINPDVTFDKLLGKDDLSSAFTNYNTKLSDPENFICENVFQFSVTFNVQVTQVTGTTSKVVNVPVTIGKKDAENSTKRFKISGLGIDCDVSAGSVTTAELASGRITSVDIAMTVVSDFGIDQLGKRTFVAANGKSADEVKSDFLAKNSYEYTKTVQIPSM
ncbi:MAG: prepilin-type N-terminal cleavage/methylation domain-containing protein [Luteolibacter sp.]|uniref:PulJ/GspJ family protein n=1 Tax=Luteolibacter sp. TaxID=1962973 RepID=UPI0032668284